MLKSLQDLLTGLKQLVTWTYLDNLAETMIEGISFSSKESEHFFVCISGYRHDDHDHVNEANHNGAVTIITERPSEAGVPVI